MDILFLTDNFPPESNAPASRTFEHARAWVQAGHHVTVITCAPNFPVGKVFDGYRNRLWQKEEVAGIQIIRVWSYITSNDGFTKRIFDYMSYMLTSFVAALFLRNHDVVVGTSPQFFTAVSAWAVAAVKRRPFVFELRDIWPESIRAVSAMRNSPVLDALEKVELFLYRRATIIVAVTHSFRTNLIDRGIDGTKIRVVTNGVDTSCFHPLEKDVELVDRLKVKDKFIAGYIGTHGMAHGLETLVEAARRLKEDPETRNIKILLLGGGANREALIESARDLDNITFLDPVPKEEVARYWSLLDTSIIHLKKNDLFKTVIPSKMFECMGMGIPILHGVEGESANIVKKYEAGLLFEPENAVELCRRLKMLQTDPSLCRRLAENGLKNAQHFNRNMLAASMLEILQSSVSTPE